MSSCNLSMFTIILRALLSLTARARFQKSPSLMLAYELRVLFSVSRSLIKRRRQFVNKWGGILKSLCKSLLFKGDRWFLQLLKATIFNQFKIKWWFWVVKPQAWWQKVVEWGATKFIMEFQFWLWDIVLHPQLTACSLVSRWIFKILLWYQALPVWLKEMGKLNFDAYCFFTVSFEMISLHVTTLLCYTQDRSFLYYVNNVSW